MGKRIVCALTVWTLTATTGVVVAVPAARAAQVADHDGDCDWRGDCGGQDYGRHQRDYDNDGEDNRRAGISPGPFDRSPVDIHDNNLTICFPFSSCRPGEGGGEGQQPVQPVDSDSDRLMCMVRSLPFHCDPKPE